MMFQHSQVCDLKTLLLIRFIFGYHINVLSPRLRFLSKAYRIILIIFVSSTVFDNKLFEGYSPGSYFFEYIIYFIISWRTNETYVYQFYRCIPIIDTLPCASNLYKKLSKFLIFTLISTVCIRLINIFNTSIAFNVPASFDAFMYLIICTMRDVGPFGVILVFSIVYLRLSIVRRTIQTHEINHINFKKYSVRSYIEMYGILVDSLDDIGLPLKFMVRI